MEHTEKYIKHNRTVHTVRKERSREEIEVTIWIADKHLHVQYPEDIAFTSTVVISDDDKALTIMACHVTDYKTENYQVKREGNLLKIPAKYARCRQRAYDKVVVPANLLILDPAYTPTIKPNVDLGTLKLVIDRRHFP